MLSPLTHSGLEVVRALIRHRVLLSALAKRDVSDDYIKHSLSSAWALIMPAFTICVYLFVFTLIFPTRIKGPESLGTDAIVYLLSGIAPWLALNQVSGRALGSVINNSNIVKQMAIPLELLPIKGLWSPLIFFLVCIAFTAAYGLWITGGAIAMFYMMAIPLALAITVLFFAGAALILGTLQVFLRDTKEFVSMYLSIGLFLHPILYVPDAVPPAVRVVIWANPFTYLIMCWQDALFYGAFERAYAWFAALAISATLFLCGARLFVGAKPYFAEAL